MIKRLEARWFFLSIYVQRTHKYSHHLNTCTALLYEKAYIYIFDVHEFSKYIYKWKNKIKMKKIIFKEFLSYYQWEFIFFKGSSNSGGLIKQVWWFGLCWIWTDNWFYAPCWDPISSFCHLSLSLLFLSCWGSTCNLIFKNLISLGWWSSQIVCFEIFF